MALAAPKVELKNYKKSFLVKTKTEKTPPSVAKTAHYVLKNLSPPTPSQQAAPNLSQFVNIICGNLWKEESQPTYANSFLIIF